MKRVDENKASLVEFLASIKFSRQNSANSGIQSSTRFANFEQRVRTNCQLSVEDSQLIRSAN